MKPINSDSVSIIMFEKEGIEEIVEVWDDIDKAVDSLDNMLDDHDEKFEEMNNNIYSNGREGEYGTMTYRIVTTTVKR